MPEFRIESDSLGQVSVPTDRLWGAQTQRSLEHFSIGHELGRFLEGRRGELGPKLLTPREIQVLQLVARGNRNKQVAAQLSIADETVRMHMKTSWESWPPTIGLTP